MTMTAFRAFFSDVPLSQKIVIIGGHIVIGQ